MRRFAAIGSCLVAFLLAYGCGPTQLQLYQSMTANLDKQLQACIDAGMTKSELIMQVGLPTARETARDNEIWIYQLTETGAIISQTTWEHEFLSPPTATTTTTRSEYNARITVRFNNRDELVESHFQGQYGALCSQDDPFLQLRPPQRTSPTSNSLRSNPAGAPPSTPPAFGDRRAWRVVRVDSEETAQEDGRGRNVLDGNPRTIWHTEWSARNPRHPHEIVIDLSISRRVAGLRYLPRQTEANGRIRAYEVYVSDDPQQLGSPVAEGELANSPAEQTIRFSAARTGRYICLRALSEVYGNPWTSVAELGILLD